MLDVLMVLERDNLVIRESYSVECPALVIGPRTVMGDEEGRKTY
jgi:hypothetical protein